MLFKQHITIIGGGPASLMLACSLNSEKYNISIYEKNAALGRKFLVAGKGGFNLTHSEKIEQFSERYLPKSFMQPFLNHFSNIDFINWLNLIGIKTYVGSSKRVFPVKEIKPIEVLNAIQSIIKKNNISIYNNYEWQGWKNNQLVFLKNNELKFVQSDNVVFALGGASWKVTGSNGNWATYFKEKGIQINKFYPSNCAYKIKWNPEVINNIAGKALKNCNFYCGETHKKGEAVLTDFGIEGSAIYALSSEIREQLIAQKQAKVFIDFKPELSLKEIHNRLVLTGKLSMKDMLDKKINLSSVQIDLLKSITTKQEYNDLEKISSLIKKFPLNIIDFAPIDDAISTVGGVALNELSQNLELKKIPNHYCIGEMIDWDAPTGGYLLQACFSMGHFLATHLNNIV